MRDAETIAATLNAKENVSPLGRMPRDLARSLNLKSKAAILKFLNQKNVSRVASAYRDALQLDTAKSLFAIELDKFDD